MSVRIVVTLTEAEARELEREDQHLRRDDGIRVTKAAEKLEAKLRQSVSEARAREEQRLARLAQRLAEREAAL